MAAVVMSDYGSITLSPAVRGLVISACRRLGIPCIVDSRYNILPLPAPPSSSRMGRGGRRVGYKTLDGDTLLEAGHRMLEAMAAEAVC
jgi:hypothetical protein